MKYSRFAIVTVLGLFLAFPVGGCAYVQKVQEAYQTITAASVSPSQALIAINGFDALEATATNYNSLRRCDGTNGPVCRNPAARKEIRKVVLAGRVARNEVKQYLRDHPSQSIAIRSYQDLIGAKDALEAILAKYKAS